MQSLKTQHLVSPTILYWMMALCLIAAFLPFQAWATPAALGTSPTGFQDVANDVYTMLNGFMGTLIALAGGGLAIMGLVRGWNPGVAAGGVGTAVAATAGPDLLVTLSGTAIF